MKEKRVELTASKPRPLALSASVYEYLGRVADDTQFLQFGSPDGPLPQDRLKLADMWQMPNVTLGGTEFLPSDLDPSKRKIWMEAREPLELRDVLTIDSLRAVVITAPPGYGKSTLCSHMVNVLASDARIRKKGWIPLTGIPQALK